MQVLWGAASHAGRVRDLNEDAFLARPSIFLVADGMGGHAAGEVASRLAVASFAALPQSGLHAEDIDLAIEQANASIVDQGSGSNREGMGTTVTGLAVVEAGGSEHWIVFNVGDSRVYRYADERLVQLSVDHSEVEELIGAGQITREQARSHPRRNIITRSLGTVPAPRADHWLLPPRHGDVFLICSDGLIDELTDEQISAVLEARRAPQAMANALVDLAVAAGGRDNITAIVVEVDRAGGGVLGDTVPRPGAVGRAS